MQMYGLLHGSPGPVRLLSLNPLQPSKRPSSHLNALRQVGVLGDCLSNASNIVRKGRLGPGQMVCADLSRGEFQKTQDLAKEVASAHPYKDWLKNR